MINNIKNILRKIFFKKQLLIESKKTEEEQYENEIKINKFREELNKDMEIYRIQKMYDEGKITEDDLTISQIKKLIKLYKN